MSTVVPQSEQFANECGIGETMVHNALQCILFSTTD